MAVDVSALYICTCASTPFTPVQVQTQQAQATTAGHTGQASAGGNRRPPRRRQGARPSLQHQPAASPDAEPQCGGKDGASGCFVSTTVRHWAMQVCTQSAQVDLRLQLLS